MVKWSQEDGAESHMMRPDKRPLAQVLGAEALLIRADLKNDGWHSPSGGVPRCPQLEAESWVS